MALRVGRGVLSRIREGPETIVLQVQDPSDFEAAVEALESAREDISNLDGGLGSAPGLGPRDRNNPKWVSEVVRAPTGPLLMLDGGFTPERLLRTIPEIITRRLSEHGVADAVVASPNRGGALTRLGTLPRAVVLRVFAAPDIGFRGPVDVPEPWLAEAAAWVSEGREAGEHLLASMMALEFPVSVVDAPAVLADWRAARATHARLVAGEFGTRIRCVSAYFADRGQVNLVLGAGGPASTDAELSQEMDALKEVAHRLAGNVAYAFIGVEPTFRPFTSCLHDSEWYLRHRGGPPEWLQNACRTFVLDAFPYQLLGPGHIARLGGSPPGARDLGGERFGLPIGEASDWFFSQQPADEVAAVLQVAELRSDPGIQERARRLLAPCLATMEDLENANQ